MTVRLVIGFGNRLRGDDAAGRVVAERLRERAEDGEMVVVEEEGAPLDLSTRWSPDAHVVLIDAARGGAPPGTVHRFDARATPLPCELLRVSTHSGGVGAAVELARALDSLPAALVVYAIEGASFELGAGLSAPVERAVGEVVERVLAELAPHPVPPPPRGRTSATGEERPRA